jgi:tetratricopeptide (TPR) repeat protein
MGLAFWLLLPEPSTGQREKLVRCRRMARWVVMLAAAAALLVAGSAAGHAGLSAEIAALSQKIEQAPNDLALRLQRAALLRRQADLESAMADLRVVEHRAPDSRPLLLERALTRKALGNLRGALADLNRFLATGAPRSDALVARAELYELLGEPERARADYDAAVRRAATPELVMARGRLDEALGKLERAAKGYEEGLAKLGGAVVVRLALIRVERARNRFSRAAELVDGLIEASPAKADWLLLRAEIHAQAGQPARARRDRLRALAELDRAIATRPTPLKRLSRAKAYLALGRARDARNDLDLVVRQAPKLEEARALLAETERSGRKQ